MKVPMIERLKAWGFEGSLSLGAAIVFSQGVISPLTLGLAGLFFALQAKADFPVYSFISSIRDELDHDYIPEESDSEDEELDQEYENEFGNAPILEGTRAEMFETSVTCAEPVSFLRKLPGVNRLLGEPKVVTQQLPKLNTAEIANMPYGVSRSGKSFRNY